MVKSYGVPILIIVHEESKGSNSVGNFKLFKITLLKFKIWI